MSTKEDKRKCAYCGQTSEQLKACSACKKVAYCSREHQRLHWKDHKQHCKPVEKKAAPPSSVAAHLRSPDAPEVQVLWEDQKRINRFGRLNNRLTELKDLVKQKKKNIANLEDAEGEIETVLDDDACIIKVGEVFMNSSNDDAETFVKKAKKAAEKELKELVAEMGTIETEMDELKKVLYGKFGTSINLEVNEEDE